MIIDNEMFERVLDGFSSEINDIEDETLQSNLQEIFDSLYYIYERFDLDALEVAENENEVMRALLSQVLSYEQKRYVRLKYNIDVDDGAMSNGVMV